MFDNIRVDYRQLLPTTSNLDDSADSPLGIYEDEESRAQRRDDEEATAFRCPDWIMDNLPNLSLRERLLGCVTCMICGYLLGLGSFVRMKDLVTGNPTPLVINVTLGNILSLSGTCFLSGPTSQLQRMFHKSRKMASIVYLATLGITMLLIMMPKHRGKGLLLFLLLLAQYAAITWYCLTYIPFAREIVKRCCRRIVSGSAEMEEF
mmetsp:Transcript_16986/g.26371  ORF Transcript_16986/g.26371 Transcript_16986/m.26371 type:complete len:206 (+) Transcript_16986:120-737(+)